MCMRVARVAVHAYAQMERGRGTNGERPTNLKRGRSERVSLGEAEVKSTVTVTLLQRRDKQL